MSLYTYVLHENCEISKIVYFFDIMEYIEDTMLPLLNNSKKIYARSFFFGKDYEL